MMRGWYLRRVARNRTFVLQALNRHPDEWFSGQEIAGLAWIGRGVVYVVLYQLEAEGIVKTRWERPGAKERGRRLYRLTRGRRG